MILVAVVSCSPSGENKEQQNGTRVLFSMFPFALYLIVGLITGYKRYSSFLLHSFSPTFKQSQTQLKEKESRQERKFNCFINKFNQSQVRH